MLSVKQGGIKYHFWDFGMTRPGIEPRSPGPSANTLKIRPMARFSVPLMDQIELLNNLLGVIFSYLKPHTHVQVVRIK